jgi:uncharacterized protein (TIGR02646 family)
MIYIDRGGASEPRWFQSEEFSSLRRKAEEFFTRTKTDREQVRFDWHSEILTSGTQEDLLRLFSSKCAYCERAVGGPSEFNIDHFRPPQASAQDPPARDHYWWLAYSWDNLYSACPECAQNKRNLFPIAGQRCRSGATGEELLGERPLLLDPCRDRPELYLVFQDDGAVMPAASLAGTSASIDLERAETTIDALGLNRESLVENRARVAQETLSAIEQYVMGSTSGGSLRRPRDLFESIQDRLAASNPFAAVRRFCCARRLPEITGLSHEDLAEEIPDLRPYLEVVRALHRQQPLVPVDVRPKPKSFVRSSVISKVAFVNYRIFDQMEVPFAETRPEEFGVPLPGQEKSSKTFERGWKMFLGENGSGKTSVLHALAVALMGKEFYRRKRKVYNLGASLMHGKEEGSIQVWLSGDREPIHMCVHRRGIKWLSGEQGANVFLRGYGASRLLPKRRPNEDPSSKAPASHETKLVDNLFDPFAPLIDAQAWLSGLNSDDFRDAATNLKRLLNIEPGQGDLEFEDDGRPGVPSSRGRFGLRWEGRFKPLEHFSAGYQTVLALACDIMAGVGPSVEDMMQTPGIVLVDEIGTNLHPRWRMEIVSRLRTAFPFMQFVASTHEPLCLRGLGKGEVTALRLEHDSSVAVINDLPSPSGLRVDQLLTSDFFGLHTAIDPELEKRFNIYYDLLEREETLSEPETQKLVELRNELAEKSVLGSSRRDRIILNIIDKFILDRRREHKPDLDNPPQDVIDQVTAALSEIGPGPSSVRP